ncbi:hypothetical protein KCP76_22400 [Salmonella enterica subsp. enterica serovar Weltevreden]|nr:hypothetical protein KCP76_22400 [Salmonella enterica subsp. enterica serovar Weltevreden]
MKASWTSLMRPSQQRLSGKTVMETGCPAHRLYYGIRLIRFYPDEGGTPEQTFGIWAISWPR